MKINVNFTKFECNKKFVGKPQTRKWCLPLECSAECFTIACLSSGIILITWILEFT